MTEPGDGKHGRGPAVGRVRVSGSSSASFTTQRLPAVGDGTDVVAVVGGHEGLTAKIRELAPSMAPWTFREVPWDRADARTLDIRDHAAALFVLGSEEARTFVREHGRRSTAPPLIGLDPFLEQGADSQRIDLNLDGVLETVRLGDLAAPLLSVLLRSARARWALARDNDELRERVALLLRGSNDGLFEWDLQRQRVFYSARFKELLGFSGDDTEFGTGPDAWLERIHSRDVALLRKQLESTVSGERASLDIEYRARTRDGRWRWLLTRAVPQIDGEGRVIRLGGSITDISDYREREQTIREQSHLDAVTDLPRRQVFVQRLARAVELARNYGDYTYCVLIVDVDRFSRVNDSLGNEIGDRLLQSLARRIRVCVRAEDTVARFDGDAFAILLEDLDDAGEGTRVASRIHEALAQPFEIDDHAIYITVSIGMTSSVRGYQRVDDVITDVNVAASRAKEAGKNRHEVFDTQMRIEAMTLMHLEMSLRRAVDQGELELHYQPIVELASRVLVGFEALIRWRSAKGTMISPGEFIPVAENTGLIVPIGRWALAEASAQLARWLELRGPGAPALSMSVNVSGRQVRDEHLVENVAQAIRTHGLADGALHLELTESVLLENFELASNLLKQFKQCGASIVIDDFGTGYSSLSYLHRLPVDGLKVDKSFIDGLDPEGAGKGSAMVSTILSLAQNYRVHAVAEGIEHEAQVGQLIGLGCRFGQGYWFSRPLSATDATALVLAVASRNGAVR